VCESRAKSPRLIRFFIAGSSPTSLPTICVPVFAASAASLDAALKIPLALRNYPPGVADRTSAARNEVARDFRGIAPPETLPRL